MYLPKNDLNPNLGTVVVKSKTNRVQRQSQRETFSNRDLQVVSQAKYVRNSVMAFAPCLNSVSDPNHHLDCEKVCDDTHGLI